MAQPKLDGVLLEWGSLLYYPRPKRAKAGKDLSLDAFQRSRGGRVGSLTAADIRAKIAATVRRAPQVMVKITGGAKGMKALRGHFNYISKRGELELRDERAEVSQGRDAVRELGDDWQIAGAYVPERSGRKEAFHITFSMPAGTDEAGLRSAVWALAQSEFTEHKHVGVFHGHQANPHVHLVVKAESSSGKRLNPRKADLQRWREGFAEELRARGIDAQATRQVTHGSLRSAEPIWRASTKVGRARSSGSDRGHRPVAHPQTLQDALVAWGQVHNALAKSTDPADQELARHVKSYLKDAPAVRALMAQTQRTTEPATNNKDRKSEPGQDLGRE